MTQNTVLFSDKIIKSFFNYSSQLDLQINQTNMEDSSKEIIDALAIKKQLALYLVGSGQTYQAYKRTQQISTCYPNDLDFYNDTFYFRHDRNIEEVKKIKQLFKRGILKPQMLTYNTWNTFYASYVMNHHFQVYLQILGLFAKNKEVQKVTQKAKTMQEVGFYAKRIINTDFGKPVNGYEPLLNKDGSIQMNENYFFYDKHISLYYHVGCFVAKLQGQSVLLFVRLRDEKGGLLGQIKVRDFGQRISTQYLQVGYNFNKVKPFLAIKLSSEAKIQGVNNLSYFSEFNLSLLDLKKSLYLAIKYTQMRVQFKTLPDSPAERPIISYQAVGSRIIAGFSKLICFSQLNRALLNNQQIIPYAAPLLDVNHHLILESVIRLRECCGGFGYLQVAGHAGCIERLTLRASDSFVAQVPQNSQILKRLHYYSSSDDMESFFGDMLTKQNAFNQSQIFSVFINVCVNMRKAASQMRKQIYLRHFMYQAAIQILKTTEQFTRFPKDSLPFLVLFYETACYILENSQFINWRFIDRHLTKQEYFRGVSQFKNKYLNKLISSIPLIEQILEVSHVRNVVVGRESSSQFYEQVLKTSRQNLRNSQEFTSYVKRPIVQFLAQNNAKL